MPWDIRYDEKMGIVAITATGEISYEDAQAQTKESVKLMREHRTSRVLADYSHGLSEVSLANLYWLVDFYREINAPTDMKAAVILPKTGHRIEAYQFHALAARNAGYNIRLFETRSEAEQWLMEGASGGTGANPGVKEHGARGGN